MKTIIGEFFKTMGILGLAFALIFLVATTLKYYSLQDKIDRMTYGGLITIKGEPTGYNYWTGENILECMTCHPRWDYDPKCTRQPIKLGR